MSNHEIQYKNVFCQQFHFHANETNFQMNGFARGLIFETGTQGKSEMAYWYCMVSKVP